MRRLPYRGDNKRILVSVLLTGFTLGFCYLFCLRYGVFGAKVDWIRVNQSAQCTAGLFPAAVL